MVLDGLDGNEQGYSRTPIKRCNDSSQTRCKVLGMGRKADGRSVSCKPQSSSMGDVIGISEDFEEVVGDTERRGNKKRR